MVGLPGIEPTIRVVIVDMVVIFAKYRFIASITNECFATFLATLPHRGMVVSRPIRTVYHNARELANGHTH